MRKLKNGGAIQPPWNAMLGEDALPGGKKQKNKTEFKSRAKAGAARGASQHRPIQGNRSAAAQRKKPKHVQASDWLRQWPRHPENQKRGLGGCIFGEHPGAQRRADGAQVSEVRHVG